MPKPQVQFNGKYSHLPHAPIKSMSLEALWGHIVTFESKSTINPGQLNHLNQLIRLKKGDHLGVKFGVDACDLGQAGWGIVFSEKADPKIIQALNPLIKHRQAHINDDTLCRVFSGDTGYHLGETKRHFLVNRNAGIGHGPVDPKKMPYYLLLVGSPEEIPFSFQYEMSLEYAVGRIDFDEVEDYEHYAHTVLGKETTPPIDPASPQLNFFAPNDDQATQLAHTYLVAPLLEELKALNLPWTINHFLGEKATKETLYQQFKGHKTTHPTPNIFLSASHGIDARDENSMDRTRALQGALVCHQSDHSREFSDEFYFSGFDLDKHCDLNGLIHLCFACFSAGTPVLDQTIPINPGAAPQKISEQAFIADLPKKMLGKHGALAFIGHVERAFSYSFYWSGIGGHTTTFESLIHALMKGVPIGHAFEYFPKQYAELAVGFSDLMEQIDCGMVNFSKEDASGLWTMRNDARNYIILGDPAVRAV